MTRYKKHTAVDSSMAKKIEWDYTPDMSSVLTRAYIATSCKSRIYDIDNTPIKNYIQTHGAEQFINSFCTQLNAYYRTEKFKYTGGGRANDKGEYDLAFQGQTCRLHFNALIELEQNQRVSAYVIDFECAKPDDSCTCHCS